MLLLESCEKIDKENLDRAVNFCFDETRNEESASELGLLDKVKLYIKLNLFNI